jgi:hypothetical protein
MVTLVFLYPFSIWYVCKLDFWVYILWVFGLAIKPGVTLCHLLIWQGQTHHIHYFYAILCYHSWALLSKPTGEAKTST